MNFIDFKKNDNMKAIFCISLTFPFEDDFIYPRRLQMRNIRASKNPPILCLHTHRLYRELD